MKNYLFFGAGMKNRIRSDEAQTAKAGLFNSVAGLLSFISGMLLMPVISQILPADDLGRAVSYASAREIVFVVLSLSAAQSVSLAMIDFGQKKFAFISSVFLFSSGSILLVFCMLLPVKKHILPLFFGSQFLFYWFFLMLLLQLTMEIITFYVNFHNRYIISFCIVFLTNTLTMLVSIILIVSLHTDKYISRIVGIDFYILVIGAAALVVILIKGKLRFDPAHIRYALKISIPLVPYMAASIVLVRSDILIMSYFASADKAGVYAMSFTIANILFVILQQIAKSWSPWVYRRLSLAEVSAVHTGSRHLVLFAFLSAVGLMIVAPELVRLFIHEEYADCVYLTGPLIVAMFFRFLNLLYYDVEYFNKKNLFNGLSHAAAAAVNILLDIRLVNVFGFSWCAVSTAICYGGLTFVHHLYAKRIEKRKIYDAKLIFVCCAVTVVLCCAVACTLDFLPVRYGILLLTGAAAAYHERVFLAGLLRKIQRGEKRREGGRDA